MKNKLCALMLGLLLAVAATFNLSAQTIGGDTALTSKTWTWTGLTADLPSTVLFTPATDSDFTLSLTPSAVSSGNVCITPLFQWTDWNGTQHGSPLFGTGIQTISQPGAQGGGGTISIHAVANTPVSFSVSFSGGCGSSDPSTVLDIVVSKIKLNP